MTTTVYFDLETGGTGDHHPTIQVAAVAVAPDWKEVEAFERKIRFRVADCDKKALTVNGFDPAEWSYAVSEGEAMRDFDAFLARHADWELVSKKSGRPYKVARLAGHNIASFDLPRVKRGMEQAGLNWWRGCWWYPLDTYQLAIWTLLGSDREPPDYKLQTLREHLGIPAPTREHEALADVRVCIQVARALVESLRSPARA